MFCAAAVNDASFRRAMSWRAVHQRFFTRLRKGVWNGLFENMAKDRDEQYIMIDEPIVRTHACAADYVKGGNEECALGRSSGGFATKIHAKVDSLGNPVKFILRKGRQHEMTQAEGLLQGSHPKAVLADKAYDSQEFQNAIEKIKAIPVIPSRKNSLCPRNIVFFPNGRHSLRGKIPANAGIHSPFPVRY